MARPRQVSDAEIITHARDCFLEKGPGVSTTVIAERVGLSQAALFKRFGTKRQLLEAALLPPEHPPFMEILARGPTEAPLVEQLVEIGVPIAAFFTKTIPCVTTLMAAGIRKEELFAKFEIPPPIRTHLATVAWFQQALAAGLLKSHVCPVDAATAFLGTLHVRAFMQHVGAPGINDDLESYVRSVATTFSVGIQEVR